MVNMSTSKQVKVVYFSLIIILQTFNKVIYNRQKMVQQDQLHINYTNGRNIPPFCLITTSENLNGVEALGDVTIRWRGGGGGCPNFANLTRRTHRFCQILIIKNKRNSSNKVIEHKQWSFPKINIHLHVCRGGGGVPRFYQSLVNGSTQISLVKIEKLPPPK